MCAAEQTGIAGPAYHSTVDAQTKPCRVPNMKHALQLKVLNLMPSHQGCGNPGARAAARDSARIRGGNWSMQGFRRSGHVHDEDECQMSIAEFMAEQALPRESYDA